MPKISSLPVVTEITPDDLLLITDNPGGRPRTKQVSINTLAVYTKDLVPEAGSSGAGLLSEEFFNDLTNATSSPIPLTLVKRDAAGRFQAISPQQAADVATKSYVDTAVEIIDNKTTRIFKQTVTGSVTTFNIDHNFGTRDVLVQVYDSATYDNIFVDILRTTVNQVQINFSSPPGTSSYRVLVHG